MNFQYKLTTLCLVLSNAGITPKWSFGKEDICKRIWNYSREMDVKRVAKSQTFKNINCLMKEHLGMDRSLLFG